jgi:CheY-like chemotaxis protein
MTPPQLLLVDDMPEVGLIVQRLGRRAGVTVVHRLRAEDAWDYLRQNRPDLVLLDVNLPGMSGPDLCRQLRATPGLADLPIAVFSTPAQQEELTAGLLGGPTFLFCKDLLARPDDFQRRLEELLRAGPAPRD